MRTLVIGIDAAAVLLGAATLVRSTITASDLLRFGLLAGLSVAYVELSRQVELRRRLFVAADSPHIDVSSVWLLASAMVLPTGLAVLVVIVTFSCLWTRSWRRVDSAYLYRTAYSCATVVLACVAVSAVARLHGSDNGGRTVLLLAVALVVYRLVNRLLILAAITLSAGPPRFSQLLGSRADNVLEFATLTLGAAMAVLTLKVPPLAVLVLPAVFLLHHRALLVQLVQAATMDGKTELLNAAAWRQVAQRELERAGRHGTATTVLVIDMDRFKKLNDTHGHLAGDEALKAVAAALSDELRGYDAVGRFGGEEFVALLPAVDATAAASVAERVRRRIERVAVTVSRHPGDVMQIGVTASIGVASAWGAAELDGMLRAADAALYRAKRAGRNTVRRAPVAGVAA